VKQRIHANSVKGPYQEKHVYSRFYTVVDELVLMSFDGAEIIKKRSDAFLTSAELMTDRREWDLYGANP